MKKTNRITEALPRLSSIVAIVISALLAVLAFPDFDLWFLAWFGLVPFFVSLYFERSVSFRGFLLGWLWGTIFFAGSCSWATFAPITYAGFPALLAYSLLVLAAAFAALFFAIFGAIQVGLFRKLGLGAFFAIPFIWVSFEFLRLWVNGLNWNAIGYSQAFNGFVGLASYGGVYLVGFAIVFINATASLIFANHFRRGERGTTFARFAAMMIVLFAFTSLANILLDPRKSPKPYSGFGSENFVVAIQPNVPMDGLDEAKWLELREQQAKMASNALAEPNFKFQATRQAKLTAKPGDQVATVKRYEQELSKKIVNGNRLIVFTESPMNYQYDSDEEFRNFIGEYARENRAAVLFNSAERDRSLEGGVFNSAVMVDVTGKKIAQYNKMYLVPFGERVPLPGFIAELIPPLVGEFSPGSEYNVFPVGDSKAGILICYESHFPSLAREFARRDVDMFIEMTNDGYLGPTAVLRQHLANAVFRAVETNRPLLRTTNIGITAYITEQGEVLDSPQTYSYASRVWNVGRSDRPKTLYVKYGDWFAVLCSIVTLGLILLMLFAKRSHKTYSGNSDATKF